jgi:hypothetical protein
MRRSQRVGFGIGLAVAVFAALSLASTGCGGKPHGTDSHGSPETTAPPPPTPDTTPIEALRTPAGLVLKIDAGTPTAPAATPSPSPAPSASR